MMLMNSKGKISNIVLVIYIGLTLLFRFFIQPHLGDHYLISVGLGLFSLLFLWAMIKSKCIRPTLLNLDQLINGDEHKSENSN